MRVELSASLPGAHESLLNRVLGFGGISCHCIQLADKPAERGGVKLGELIGAHPGPGLLSRRVSMLRGPSPTLSDRVALGTIIGGAGDNWTFVTRRVRAAAR
jgi:hypothetical protein